MLIYCRPKLKSDFVFQTMRFHIYFTYWVQSGKCSLRKINNPRKTIHAVPSTFSPGEYPPGMREIFPGEGIWTKVSHPPVQAIWLLTYGELWTGTLFSPTYPYTTDNQPYTYHFVIHFARNTQPHFPVSTILEVRTNSVLLGYATYKYFLQ